MLLNFTFKRQNNSTLEIDSACRPMMGQQTAEIDEESLQTTGHRRRSCLDVFLVTSIIFLFLAVAAVAAVVGMNMIQETQGRTLEGHVRERTTGEACFKVRTGSHLGEKKTKQTYFQSHFLSTPV